MTNIKESDSVIVNTQDLIRAWMSSPHPSIKTSSYFPVYAKLFAHLRHTQCTFVETGILEGGSLFMWRQWLGTQARIVGIDLNPDARKWENFGFEIFIGDQADRKFWEDTLGTIGSYDALLDDGGHQSFQQIVTTEAAIKYATRPCLIVIEDTYTSFMNDFASHGENSFLQYAKASTDCLTARSHQMYKNRFPTPSPELLESFGKVFSIEFFNGITVFKIDPNLILDPENRRNRPSTGSASDFRYEGLEEAEIVWPNIFDPKKKIIKGQRNPKKKS